MVITTVHLAQSQISVTSLVIKVNDQVKSLNLACGVRNFVTEGVACQLPSSLRRPRFWPLLYYKLPYCGGDGKRFRDIYFKPQVLACRKAGCIKECNKYLLQLSILISWKYYSCSFYDNVTFLGNSTNSSINSE